MSLTELHIAEAAARDAAGVLREHFRRGVSMRSKEIANFVTDADLEAERAIVAAIRKHRPDHEILAEETERGDAGAEHLWVVDPLDATHNFAHQVPHFSTSIAYYRDGRAEVGVVVNPLTDEWYRAERGKGAFLNGMPVRVNDHERLDQTMLACGFPYDRGALMEATLKSMGDLIRSEIHGIRRMGCASLDLCWVGLGRFAGFFEYLLSPWDYAAGRLFVEEAGGVVTDCRGGALGLGKSPVLATNGKIHAAMLEIVARNHPA
ncbi:MAG: inositol monophosphatase family protein [Isosphaeraceae bacterium]